MAGREAEEGAPLKAVSKYLALILRHRPQAGGLKLDAQGWAPVEQVLAAVRRRFGDFSRTDLEELVRTNDKKRYAFDATGERIRASQGHSIGVNLGLEAVAPPSFLFHGTTSRFLDSILDQGLVNRRRHHVHLSEDVETATKVGRRRAGETIIFRIAAGEMAAAGHVFYRSANHVWLTDAVPPAYLSIEKG